MLGQHLIGPFEPRPSIDRNKALLANYLIHATSGSICENKDLIVECTGIVAKNPLNCVVTVGQFHPARCANLTPRAYQSLKLDRVRDISSSTR